MGEDLRVIEREPARDALSDTRVTRSDDEWTW
jgi:hypothetical protein